MRQLAALRDCSDSVRHNEHDAYDGNNRGAEHDGNYDQENYFETAIDHTE